MSLSHRQETAGLEEWGAWTDRRWTQSGLTLAEGTTLAQRLLASALEPVAVVCTEAHLPAFTALAAGRCPVSVLTAGELARWAGFPFHRGVAVIARRPKPLTLEAFLSLGPRRLAAAPRLTDAENLGSVFRSALALGWDAVAVGHESCDPYSRRTAKVSMGAVYAHPPVELPEPARCRELLSAWTNVALALEPDAVSLDEWAAGEGRMALSGPVSLWLGNEFEGLDASWRAVCDRALVLPMAEGHDSLNVAVAAGIGLYTLAMPLKKNQEKTN